VRSKGTSLIRKRNCAIYLFEATNHFGKREAAVSDRFLALQQVFFKFLFDRKPIMQDISSRALTLIYQNGSESVKGDLVDALSKTLSGEKSASDVEEKDESNELFFEFKDSSEFNDKLKTYKDLCTIATDLGHRELIYSFLEVHRHMAAYQNMKNAAKGLN